MAVSFSCNSNAFPINIIVASQQQHHRVKVNFSGKKHHQNVQNLIKNFEIPEIVCSPHESLQRGNWVKLICGASFEEVVDIRNLSLVYTLAGVDCIDCAADASVVNAVNQGIEAARKIFPLRRPWVMISISDDKDLHFRKAEFDPRDCPVDCSRPCENVCPANAILLQEETQAVDISYSTNKLTTQKDGVITERCYGCGRCFPICPYDKIRAMTYLRDVGATSELLKKHGVDAIEVHTSGRRPDLFGELWNGLGDSTRDLKLVAVSLPDLGISTIPSLNILYAIMKPHICCYNLWQLDGRPMSGDIGRGATKEAIAFATHMAAEKDRPPGFLQLAGGTNLHTVDGLKKAGLFQTASSSHFFMSGNPRDATSALNLQSSTHALIGGIAYGSYARKIVGRILNAMQVEQGGAYIEDSPEYLVKALNEATALVGSVKCYKVGNLEWRDHFNAMEDLQSSITSSSL